MHWYVIGLAEDTSGSYAKGTGGTVRTTIQTNNAGNPSGVILATQDTVMLSVDGSNVTTTFSAPPLLTAGTIYHIVRTNVDASPTANYVSEDATFNLANDTIYQPVVGNNTDWCQGVKAGASAWVFDRGGSSGINTPICDIAYSNGSHQGLGYIETWGRGGSDGYNTVDGTIKLRETFTVTGGNVTVSDVHIRLARTSGVGALSLRLETSANVEIETVTIAAAGISTAAKGGSGHGFGQAWYSVAFLSSHVLTSGMGYNLVLSTTAGTEYWLTAVRTGASFGYSNPTFYTDGHAQIATDGSTWANVKALTGSPSAEGNLQFYMTKV